MTLLEYLRQINKELGEINLELDELIKKVEELNDIPADLVQRHKDFFKD